MFEKYGGDPLKRSLKNQLITQFGYAMMLNNTICTPCLTWRILFGPVHIGEKYLGFFKCDVLAIALHPSSVDRFSENVF